MTIKFFFEVICQGVLKFMEYGFQTKIETKVNLYTSFLE